ncbi:hypothetical protein C8R43DRAFT_1104095 [Mycena crocata]|nr:hypothetical protein C8R43DRAFT_1104095 [Mycena crocata]
MLYGGAHHEGVPLMAACSPVGRPTSIPQPSLPEDVERAINDMLLNDAQEMRGSMSLVAARFHAWTKPHTFRTVVVRQHDNWTKRIRDLLLPNAHFIRVLALNLPLREGISDEDLCLIRRLVQAADRTVHLAITWNLWADFQVECGRLQLQSLYLIWDGATQIPSLQNLQHPEQLTDLSVYAPPDLEGIILWRGWGRLFLPAAAHCPNLAFLTYASDRTPLPTIGSLCATMPSLKGAMFVCVDISGTDVTGEGEDALLMDERDRYPNFSTAHLPSWTDVLGNWVAKMESGQSILMHPPSRIPKKGETKIN